MAVLKRELTLNTVGGTHSILVLIAAPVQHDRYWQCGYSIGWPEGKKQGVVRGADSLQVVYLAMQAIAVGLYASDHHKAGRLYWEKPGQGYGFPMPKVGRDQLVGEDRIDQS